MAPTNKYPISFGGGDTSTTLDTTNFIPADTTLAPLQVIYGEVGTNNYSLAPDPSSDNNTYIIAGAAGLLLLLIIMKR